MGRLSLAAFIGRVRRILHRPKSRALAASLVAGRKGIEVGGPSAVFDSWLVYSLYKKVESLDNCDFTQSNAWAEHGNEFRFNAAKPAGKVFFCDATDMGVVQEGAYDFLLSSHNLEHLANPVKGIKQWQRVVKPGGYLILVLPHYQCTGDKMRRLTRVAHMVEDYERDTPESDLTHVEEIIADNKLTGEAAQREREVLRKNFEHRTMHQHTFDERNSRELLEAAGLKVMQVEFAPPFHVILIAQFPERSV